MAELSIHVEFIGVPPNHRCLPNRMKKIKNGNFLCFWVITGDAIKNVGPKIKIKFKIYPIGNCNLT